MIRPFRHAGTGAPREPYRVRRQGCRPEQKPGRVYHSRAQAAAQADGMNIMFRDGDGAGGVP
jgi:hypothetical protein